MCVPSIYSRIVTNFTRDDPRRYQKLTDKEDIYPANSMKGRQGRYAELSSKPCSYSNNLANGRPTNGKVSSPIKVKIQNAINRALQGETEDSGVIVVGGRRRNRKRRPNKNKPTKNENQKPKKNKKTKKINGDSSSDSSDKENGHSFNIYAAITKATSAGRKRDDQKPLIGSEWRSLDGKEFDDRDGDSGFWTPDTENDDNQDSDTMPFGFGKKKKNAALIEKEVSPPPQQFKEEQNAEIMSVKADEPAYIAEDATANDAGHIAVTQALVEEETMVEVVASEAVDGGTNQMIIETELPAEPIPVETIVDKPVFDTPAPVVEKQQKKQPRVESTPLIRKQPTKVKDTQPGFLCCTII